ncbi:hypothetical protein JCM8097_007717 [Rhodosporidiobolus ruineniae]
MLSLVRPPLTRTALIRPLHPLRPLSTASHLALRPHLSPPRPSRLAPACHRPLFRSSAFPHARLSSRLLSTDAHPPPAPPPTPPQKPEQRENIYTLPNALTVARIATTPFIGYYTLQGDWATATGLLFAAGVSDLVDGWLARRFNMGTVLGSILDPAADKLLMTTLVVTLAMKGMLPVPLAVIILGRDIALSISAFYIRYASLPPPKTFARYWDFSIPSASVHPTQISKYNTFLQLLLVGSTTVAPLLPFDVETPLMALQWIVAGTTIWSGLSYVGTGSASAVKYIK